MRITESMLHAATRKAVELGILPRRSRIEDLATNVELMQEILQAALDAAQEEKQPEQPPGPPMESAIAAIPPSSGATASSFIPTNRR